MEVDLKIPNICIWIMDKYLDNVFINGGHFCITKTYDDMSL